MARRSSYRLGRRLKSSAKARLDYITYLQSGGDPSRQSGNAPISFARFGLGGGMTLTGFREFTRQSFRMTSWLGGMEEVRVAKIQQIKADYPLGGNFRLNIFPPVTIRAQWGLGGSFVANAVTPRYISADYPLGGNFHLDVSIRVPARLGADMGLGGTMVTGVEIPVIEDDPDALAIIAAMTTVPSTERQTLIKSTVPALKQAGLWDKIDVLYVHAAHTKQAASLNWKTPGTLGLNPTGTYAFTADVGVGRAGAAVPTDVDFVADAADYVYAQNSGHIGILAANGNNGTTALSFRRTDGLAASSPYTAINLRNTSDMAGFVNSGTAIISPVIPEDTAGHWVISRTGPTTSKAFHKGVEVATSAGASAVLSAGRLYLMYDAAYATTQQVTHIGSGLTNAEVADLHDILTNYLANL